MKSLIAALVLITTSTFAQTAMGPEVVEMFQVMRHPQVQECLEEVGSLMNVSIEKKVARCPYCTTYKISGQRRNIDTPSVNKTVITLKGSAERGFGGQLVQKFDCSVVE